MDTKNGVYHVPFRQTICYPASNIGGENAIAGVIIKKEYFFTTSEKMPDKP
jgi:hypothetical protein